MKEIPRVQTWGREWIRWLNDLKNAVDEIRVEPHVTITSDTTLTVNDLGLVHYCNIGSNNVTVYLPSVDNTDLWKWIKFVRVGTGTLLIRASDSDKIEYSSQPGRIWCNEPKRYAANLTFQLVNETQWGILGGTGIWKIA